MRISDANVVDVFQEVDGGNAIILQLGSRGPGQASLTKSTSSFNSTKYQHCNTFNLTIRQRSPDTRFCLGNRTKREHCIEPNIPLISYPTITPNINTMISTLQPNRPRVR